VTRLAGCRVVMFGSLTVPLSQAPLMQNPPSARLQKNARIERFSRARLARCSLVRAHAPMSAAARWRELARVTFLFAAIHRVYLLLPVIAPYHSTGR
jgi:hypothetical protein